MSCQHRLEKKCFDLAGNTQSAPAQRVTDFLAGKSSQSLPPASYIPGLTSSDLHKELPDYLKHYLKEALRIFNKKMRGYVTEEAILVAPESRTSSPIRIPRDRTTLMHSGARGLFPSGEGAGYAGGIVSAAIDGENCAEAAATYINNQL